MLAVDQAFNYREKRARGSVLVRLLRMCDDCNVVPSVKHIPTIQMADQIRIAFVVLVAFLLSVRLTASNGSLDESKALAKAGPPFAAKTQAATSSGAAGVAQELRTFEQRCGASGVLVCQGFDTPAEYGPARYPSVGLYPAWDGAIRGVRDTSVKASGTASLRFEVPSHSEANASGYWKQPMGKEFREGSTFYVQFRQRFSKEMLKNNWGGTTWKQAIFHNAESTCGAVELTTVQYYDKGFPIMYTNCGAHSLFSSNGTPPTKLEQGDYNCWYGKYNAKDCFFYPIEEWVTFYYEISIGHWGKPDSGVNAWVALDGKPYKQWIQMSQFVLEKDRPGEGFDTVTLLTYMTAKSAQADHAVAYTWYDDLIISANPIAPPSMSNDKQNSSPARQ
jgi:hypothetical protein